MTKLHFTKDFDYRVDDVTTLAFKAGDGAPDGVTVKADVAKAALDVGAAKEVSAPAPKAHDRG